MRFSAMSAIATMVDTNAMDMIDRDWIKARLTGRRGEIADLARAMGIGADRVAKILSGTRQVQAREIPAITEFFAQKYQTTFAEFVPQFQAPTAQSQRQTGQTRPGMAEDAAPYAPPHDRPGLAAVLTALVPHARQPSYLRLVRNLPAFSMLSGDIAIIDLGRQATDGDLVTARRLTPDGLRGITLIRRKSGDRLLSGSPDDADQSLVDDGRDVVTLYPVVGVLRVETDLDTPPELPTGLSGAP